MQIDKQLFSKFIGCALFYLKTQTPKICLEVVRQDGMALEYVETQTLEICLEVVRQDSMASKYIRIKKF